jgi:hypothetical protein
VATDFFEAALNGPGESALALLTPELAQEIKVNGLHLVGWHLFDPDSYSKSIITSEQDSPDGNEVIVMGTLKSRVDGRPDGEFRVRVARDAQVWKIRFVLVKEQVASSPSSPDAHAVFYEGKPADYWVNRLKDKAPSFRHEALDALTVIAEEDKAVIPALVKSLGDKDHSVADHAVTLLVCCIGKDALPDLLKALDVESSRCLAMHVIGELRADATEAVPSLLKYLGDSKSDECYYAASAIGRIGPGAKAAVPLLIKLLEEESPLAAALWGLQGIGTEAKDAIPVLKKLLKNPDGKWSGDRSPEWWRKNITEVLMTIDPEAKTYLPAESGGGY